jgi:hypothetical protein
MALYLLFEIKLVRIISEFYKFLVTAVPSTGLHQLLAFYDFVMYLSVFLFQCRVDSVSLTSYEMLYR